MDGICLDYYPKSEHAGFLSTALFNARSAYDRTEEGLWAIAPEGADFDVKPPAPFFLNGKPVLSATAKIADAETGEKVPGVLMFEYDFDLKKPLSCEFKDGRTEYERYFGWG